MLCLFICKGHAAKIHNQFIFSKCPSQFLPRSFQLRDLLTKIDHSDKLENIIDQVMKNKDDFEKLASELGLEKSGDGNKEDK